MCTYLKLEKQSRLWIVTMAIGEELYFYEYSLFFPNSFLPYHNKYDSEVKLKFMKSISIIGLEKRFCVEDFLNKFSISNKKRREVKEIIIDLFDELKDDKLIEDQFQLINKCGSLRKVTKLTPLRLSKRRYICFSETISFNRLKKVSEKKRTLLI